MSPRLPAVALLVLAACGDDGGTRDASVDTPIDPVCGVNAAYTGEIVDWDASNAKFCGVFNAKLTVRSDTSLTDQTNPNGRFELCVPHADVVTLDLAYSTTPSECTDPKEAYPVPGVAILLRQAVDAPLLFSARAMTPTRQASMFTQVGQAYNAAKAQLVVHVVSTVAPAVSIDRAHAAVQAFNGASWVAGDTGIDVFFPNVDPGSTTITVPSTDPLPKIDLVAGKYTYVTVATGIAFGR